MTGLTASNRTDKMSTVIKASLLDSREAGPEFTGSSRIGSQTGKGFKTPTKGLNQILNKSMTNSVICKFWLKSRQRL